MTPNKGIWEIRSKVTEGGLSRILGYLGWQAIGSVTGFIP